MSDHQTGFGDVQFTISNGQVTDVERVVGSRTIDLGLPAKASFSVGSGSVTETLTHGSTTGTLTYTADASNPSLYHLSQEQQTFDTSAGNAPTYGFTITNGAVTAMTESLGASGRTHSIDVGKLPATSFTASASSVTETTVHGNTVETLQFTTSDGSAYKLASDTESFVSAGTATTRLDVEPGERMSFTFSGDTVTAAQLVKPDGTTVALSSHADVSYAEPAAGYVVETITHGSHSDYEVFHDGNGDGIYTAVAHGTGSTVDIVGLQAQITPLINTLL
jgi:hypothetical protein